MNIYEILDEIDRAYPENVFPELTEEERAHMVSSHRGVMDRISASMGRHLAKVIREKLAEREGEELVRAAEKVYQLRYEMYAKEASASVQIALAMIELNEAAKKIREGDPSNPSDVGNLRTF